MSHIEAFAAAQDVLPVSNGNGEHPPAPKPKRKRRLSPAARAALISEAIAQPRSPELALAALKASHPDITMPRHILRDLKIAGCARRLHALGATPIEVLGWLERF
jgi:hypothetical protein